MQRILTIMNELHQTATAPGAAPDINALGARPEPTVEWPAAGEDLPEQGGGQRSTLLPGVSTFRLPDNLAALWHDITAEDRRKFNVNGQPNPTLGQKIQRRQLKFDRNTPLVVIGGPLDGEPMTATFSTHPRPRSMKKNAADDPTTPWISDAAYLLDVGLNDKSRPSDPKALEAAINHYGGKTVRIEHGLTAQCRPDKVRYIRTLTGGVKPDGSPETKDVADPTGKKGCGKRFYTKEFKRPEGGYDTEIACVCGTPTADEAAAGATEVDVVVRAFEQVERILPPLGA